METDPLDPQAALDAVSASERRSVELVTSTPWYAPWYGVTSAAFPVAIALLAVRSTLGIVLLVLGSASLVLLVRTYLRVTGVWPSEQGMLVYVIAAVVVVFGTGIASYLVARSYGVSWWLLAVAVVTAVLMALLSRGYDRAYARKHGA